MRLVFLCIFVAAVSGCATTERPSECSELLASMKQRPDGATPPYEKIEEEIDRQVEHDPATAGMLCKGVLAELKGRVREEAAVPPRTIDHPEPGTPEWVVYQAIAAALVDDIEAGYQQVKPLLHSEITDSPAATDYYRNLVFEAFHRRAALYALDDVSGAFKLDYVTQSEPPDTDVRIFVVNEASDMPTPCRVKRDPKADGAWRLSSHCSL